jgi:solute carrier family 13 (sodium-dependent dicarboxylate transporter), member 2/3/5
METEAREKEREEVEDVGGRKTYRSAIAASADVDPTIPALAAIFGANYGFMLPVSTPPNAIVYSSGMLPITRMIKAGAVFDIIGIVLCVIGVVAMANLVGLA